MAQDSEQCWAAAQHCVRAAWKCIDDDADAAASLFLMAQRWIELAQESIIAPTKNGPAVPSDPGSPGEAPV